MKWYEKYLVEEDGLDGVDRSAGGRDGKGSGGDTKHSRTISCCLFVLIELFSQIGEVNQVNWVREIYRYKKYRLNWR